MLLEIRSNPGLNPKISIYKNLKKYYDLDVKKDEFKYFIHLTGDIRNNKNQKNPNLPKFGINPRQNYSTTPFGIFTYPLKDSWTFYKIGTNENLEGITYPDAEKDRKYVYVIKTINSINLLNVETYTEAQLEKDKKLLNQLYDYDFSEKYEKTGFDSTNPFIKFPYFKLKNITYTIATRYSKNKIIVTWSTIFKRLGYDGIYDPGIGLIHPNEPCQCVFFYKDVIKEVALYENKEYLREKEKANKRIFTFKDKKYIGEMKNGILHFTDLYIGSMNIKSLKELPWSKQPYIVSNNFECTSNLLEDLEGGPIYAETYNCSFNKLTSLKGAPNEVKYFICVKCSIKSLQYGPNKTTTLDCSNNPLESLVGAPEECVNFICSVCELTSLKGAPDKVEIFNCSSNKDLTTLRYSPKIVDKFNCSDCSIESLQYISDNINYLNCKSNKLKNLKGAPKKLKELDISNNDIRSLKDLEECEIIGCDGNENLKLDFKPKNLKFIEGISSKRMNDFLVKNKLEE